MSMEDILYDAFKIWNKACNQAGVKMLRQEI